MRKILAYPLTVVYFIFFGLLLLIFHPIQWICLNVFGYEAHKKSVSIMNLGILRLTHLLGTRYSFAKESELPRDRPLILVANHQSMYDIPMIIWFLRACHPKFVSKMELGKGIPSVSYNLRHGGSVLINRKDSRQALTEISKLGKYIEETKRAAVIFPEGTRSRDGHPKNFQLMGLRILMKTAPSALVVPITINNSWKMLRYGKFPHGIASHLKMQVHAPMEQNSDPEALLDKVEKKIKESIKNS
ncbi:lysophospholipid acyltransferase family protein [Zeaxanthinibacter enoshimensis]|uniref:lysophospholipid acyltransferase family protein n=1 Tax=Zeaxanthinibacter enoshimensis TaxID=392009 RepID=UPI00356AFC4F